MTPEKRRRYLIWAAILIVAIVATTWWGIDLRAKSRTIDIQIKGDGQKLIVTKPFDYNVNLNTKEATWLSVNIRDTVAIAPVSHKVFERVYVKLEGEDGILTIRAPKTLEIVMSGEEDPSSKVKIKGKERARADL